MISWLSLVNGSKAFFVQSLLARYACSACATVGVTCLIPLTFSISIALSSVGSE